MAIAIAVLSFAIITAESDRLLFLLVILLQKFTSLTRCRSLSLTICLLTAAKTHLKLENE